MDEWIGLTKALCDESRVRVLMFLHDGELCACHIIDMLKLAPSTVSAHMAILHRAGLVEVRKEGRWRHFRLARKSQSPLARKLLGLARKALLDDARVARDQKRLKTVLRESESLTV